MFVNYNGHSKSRCTVEDGAFIGCNTNLVAPVKVGEKMRVIIYKLYAFDDQKAYLLENNLIPESAKEQDIYESGGYFVG